jgi:hypothetical protein
VLALAAGAGTEGGAYQGDGYAVVWRSIVGMSEAEPLVELLDRDGRPALGQGPFSYAGPSPYPGFSTSIVWSGQTYLTATAFSRPSCTDSPRCARAVIVGSVRPSNGRDAGGVINTATFFGETGGPLNARIASYGGRTWVAWFEADPDVPTTPRTLRLARVDPNGEAIGGAFTIAKDAHPVSRLTFLAAETGLTMAWIEDGAVGLSDDKPGRSHLALVHGTLDGTSFAPLPPLFITRFASYGIAPTLAALESPHGVVVSYTARSRSSPMSPAWLTRFDCRAP